jgi:antirestriction protein ArdC
MQVYQQITQTIIDAINNNPSDWKKTWRGLAMPIRATGQAYQGFNILNLWGASNQAGYESPRWLTFKQCIDLGGKIRKGEKATTIVYSKPMAKESLDDAGNATTDYYHCMKAYQVFNAQQADGLAADVVALPTASDTNPDARDARIDGLIARTGATIEHRGGAAFYSERSDTITMPAFTAFFSKDDYYATMLHELTHWTGHKTRLARFDDKKNTSNLTIAERAFEELIAELGAAFLCSKWQVTEQPRADHAAYIANWLGALKKDQRFIVKAASAATKAAEYINAL